MKLHADVYHVNKQPSLEDGLSKYEIMDESCTSTIDRKSNRCNRWLHLMKLILYLELILFIGWIGCVFITNYYQPRNSNGTVEQHGSSEWLQNPKSPDSTVTSNSVSHYTTRRSTNQDGFETTTSKSETQQKFANANKNVESHVEMTKAPKIIKLDERAEKSMVHWLNSWAKGRGNWDDSSSESTSSQNKLDWDSLSIEKSAFNGNMDEVSSIENHFGATNEDDEMDLGYLLTLPLWHNVLFTHDSLDKSVDSDKDSFDESTEDYRRSRQTRSADKESSSSSSSSSEESNKTRGEPDDANGESSNEDECAANVDDEGNVMNEARDGNDWVSLLKEADIPECEKSQVAKSVTVDRCGKIAVTCVDDDKDDPPIKHHRRTRNAETKNTAEESCEQRFALWLQNLKAWRARIVKEGSAGQMVQEVYQNIQEHVDTLIKQAIVDRSSSKPRKTEEEWHDNLVSMMGNVAELMDFEHRNLLLNDNELTSKMGASLGEIVETAVDIRMDCQGIISMEQKNCLQSAKTMTLLDNKLAAQVVPGESTNSEVRTLRRLFKPHALFLILDIIQYKKTNVLSGMSSRVDLTDEQLTSSMHGLKQKMLHFAKYTDLRTELEDRVSPTSEETNLLREMVDYYSHTDESCSMAHLKKLLVALNPRKTRAVSADSPTVVTCTLDDDDVQFMQERKERFDHYNQTLSVNMGTVRIRPLMDVIEERLNGIAPTKNSDEDMDPGYMSYIRALDVFLGNTSTELKNEGNRLMRDIILESKYLEDNRTASEGYDLDEMMQNWTASCLMHIEDNYTAETILMAIIKLSETLNLHYTGAEDNKTCGDEFTPVYGTFTYVGEEPQKSIVRQWRHIFEAMVKLYFDTHNPQALPSCANDKEGSESSTTATCASKDDIAQFGQERQERLDRYKRFEQRISSDSWTEHFLDAIEEKLNGVTSTEDSDDKPAPPYMRHMNIFNVFVGNSSTDLKNAGYRLLRDIVLEIKFMHDNRPAALEGYVMDTIMGTWAENCLENIGGNYTAETILIAVMKAAEGIDLRYSGLGSGKNCNEQFTPTYGTFTYVGEAPEKSLVRRWRHIFNNMARLYFRMYNPEVLPKYNCKEQSGTMKANEGAGVNRMGKRSIGYPSRKSDNSLDVDEKAFGNDDNGRLIKVSLDPNAEPRNFDLSQDSFIDKMEMLSAHIDRLHEMYQKYNELNDDYVSEEFPVDLTSNYKY